VSRLQGIDSMPSLEVQITLRSPTFHLNSCSNRIIMHEPAHQTPSKHRQPKLRASCDTCFLAKVKCSKVRPVCSRCLACGAECKYRPSCRAGKPKSGLSRADQRAAVEVNAVRHSPQAKRYLATSNMGTQWSREPQEVCPTPSAIFGSLEENAESGSSSSVTPSPTIQEGCLETEGPTFNKDGFSPLFG
jgi:hypothetical protein